MSEAPVNGSREGAKTRKKSSVFSLRTLRTLREIKTGSRRVRWVRRVSLRVFAPSRESFIAPVGVERAS